MLNPEQIQIEIEQVANKVERLEIYKGKLMAIKDKIIEENSQCCEAKQPSLSNRPQIQFGVREKLTEELAALNFTLENTPPVNLV